MVCEPRVKRRFRFNCPRRVQILPSFPLTKTIDDATNATKARPRRDLAIVVEQTDEASTIRCPVLVCRTRKCRHLTSRFLQGYSSRAVHTSRVLVTRTPRSSAPLFARMYRGNAKPCFGVFRHRGHTFWFSLDVC